MSNRIPLILVVDDDVATNMAIQGILEKVGFRVVCSFDVAGALDEIRRQCPDLILLDITLPDGNGIDVCRDLQHSRNGFRSPIIFISANDDVSVKVQGFEAGGVDYITKPVAAAEVIARVRTHLRLRQAYDTLAELQAERIQRLAVVQEAIMPQPRDFPEASFYVSLTQRLRAGGDFYDVIPFEDQLVDYIVADASGHDLAASLWTAALKALLLEYAGPVNTPQDVLRGVNAAFCRLLPPGMYYTLIHARIDRRQMRLTLSNAGHPPALLVPGNGDNPSILLQEGDVLGAFPDAVFGMSEVSLHRGDRVFLFSDGLIERHGNRKEGLQWLLEAGSLFRSRSLEDSVHAMVEYTMGDGEKQDDVVLMGILV